MKNSVLYFCTVPYVKLLVLLRFITFCSVIVVTSISLIMQNQRLCIKQAERNYEFESRIKGISITHNTTSRLVHTTSDKKLWTKNMEGKKKNRTANISKTYSDLLFCLCAYPMVWFKKTFTISCSKSRHTGRWKSKSEYIWNVSDVVVFFFPDCV